MRGLIFKLAVQGRHVQQLNVLVPGRDQSALLQAAEHAADGFHGQAQVMADIGARHGQAEALCRQLLPCMPRGQAEQQGDNALSGTVLTEQQGLFLFVIDFLAQQAHQMSLHVRQVAAQFAQTFEGNGTDGGGFQRFGTVAVPLRADAVQTQHFAGQVKAGDLFAPVRAEAVGFQGAGTHGIKRAEAVTGLIQVFALVQRAATLYQLIQRMNFIVFQSQWQAQGIEPAMAAGDAGAASGSAANRVV